MIYHSSLDNADMKTINKDGIYSWILYGGAILEGYSGNTQIPRDSTSEEEMHVIQKAYGSGTNHSLFQILQLLEAKWLY